MSFGVLLVNLGSPDSPEPGDVRRYLREFLSDDRVLDSPKIIQQAVLNLFILPKRPKESGEAYAEIWTDDGSPLIISTEKQRDALRERFDFPIEIGMRYGKPSTRDGVQALVAKGVKHIFLIPLYPHYAMSSYETAVAKVREEIDACPGEIELTVQPPFYDDPDYIDALVAVAKDHMPEDYDQLLFSYHGIPQRHITKGDPTGYHCFASADCCEKPSPAHATCYRAQVKATTRLFVEKAEIPFEKWTLSFQSRLTKEPWLKPYTDFELEEFPTKGLKKIAVICPAFISDCLETLEEIDMRGREDFIEAGGHEFHYIPCLNDDSRWIDVMAKWIEDVEGAE